MCQPDRHTNQRFDWTDEAVKDFRTLWSEGVPCEEIADRLMAKFGGFLSRSAIAGKKKRLKLSARRTNGGDASAPYTKRQRSKPRHKPKPTKQKLIPHIIMSGNHSPPRIIFTPDGSEPTISSLSPDEISIEQRKRLLDLRLHDCRWPYGDPRGDDFFFCGAVAAHNSSYCAFHCRVSAAPSNERRRAA